MTRTGIQSKFQSFAMQLCITRVKQLVKSQNLRVLQLLNKNIFLIWKFISNCFDLQTINIKIEYKTFLPRKFMFSGVIIYLILQTPSLHLIQGVGFSLTVPIYSDMACWPLWEFWSRQDTPSETSRTGHNIYQFLETQIHSIQLGNKVTVSWDKNRCSTLSFSTQVYFKFLFKNGYWKPTAQGRTLQLWTSIPSMEELQNFLVLTY